MTAATTDKPCIPVRVWIGYALPELRIDNNREQFCKTLGQVFIPATVQMMQPLGLSAYLPTILPSNTDTFVPDEIALVIYPSCQRYEHAKSSSTGGRAYQLLHSTLFNFQATADVPASHSAFPLMFDSERIPNTPYGSFSLFSNMVDWQSGTPTVLAADFKLEKTNELPKNIFRQMAEIQKHPPHGLDGLIFYLCENFVIVWSHWKAKAYTLNLLKNIDGLRTVLNSRYTEAHVPMPITTDYPGLAASPGDSYNFQFALHSES